MKSDWHDLRPGDFVILEIRSMEKDDDDNHIIEFCESTPTSEDWPDALVFKKNFPVEVADPQWLKKDPSVALDEMERERDVALANLSKAQGECDVLIAAVAEAHDVQSTLAAKLGEIEKAYHGYMNHHADEPLLTVLSRFFPEKDEETK